MPDRPPMLTVCPSSSTLLSSYAECFYRQNIGGKYRRVPTKPYCSSLPPDIQVILKEISATNERYACYAIRFQTSCFSYSFIDYASVDFLMTSVILAMLEILIF